MKKPDIATVDADRWAEARRCLPVIRRLAEHPARTRKMVEDAAAELSCGATRVYDLIDRYVADPRLTSLLTSRRGPAVGYSRKEPEIEALISETIDSFYLTRQQPRLADLVREIARRCRERGLKPPGRWAINARLDARPGREVTGKRRGRKAAGDRYRPVVGSLEAEWPLSLVQIDHTLVDVIVVDSETRQPIQRPWLTLAIDVFSRCVAGFHLSLEPPSATSVALCLTHAALPKTNWQASRRIEAEWPVQGIPERLHLDNAKEFRSEALKRGCEQYGIGIDHRPVRTPHYGGHIERLIGTMMGKAHLLPGTTFSNITAKGDLDPSRSAAMTLDEVEHWLGHAVAAYHHDLHRGIGTTPLAKWELGLRGDGDMPGRGELVAVVDPRRFLIDFLPIERRLVRREGVQLYGITYWSDVLATWIGHPGRMILRYDPRDLSRIYLLGPDDIYYDLNYRDLRRPPISLWEHRLATRQLHNVGLGHVNEAAIFEAVDAMRAIADEAVRATKTARRQRARRPLGRVAQSNAGVDQAAIDWPAKDDLQPHERMLPVEEWS
jgi:putative transposase